MYLHECNCLFQFPAIKPPFHIHVYILRSRRITTKNSVVLSEELIFMPSFHSGFSKLCVRKVRKELFDDRKGVTFVLCR